MIKVKVTEVVVGPVGADEITSVCKFLVRSGFEIQNNGAPPGKVRARPLVGQALFLYCRHAITLPGGSFELVKAECQRRVTIDRGSIGQSEPVGEAGVAARGVGHQCTWTISGEVQPLDGNFLDWQFFFGQ